MNQEKKSNIQIENHFAKRVMIIRIRNSFQTDDLKQIWSKQLRLWHSPYRVLFIHSSLSFHEKEEAEILILQSFFKQFFLKDLFCVPKTNQSLLKSFESEEEAFKFLNLHQVKNKESSLVMKSEYEKNFIEIEKTPFPLNEEKLTLIQKKIYAELMRWHAPFCLLWNCDEIEFEMDLEKKLLNLEKALKKFHCLKIIFYSTIKLTQKPNEVNYTYGRHAALEAVKQVLQNYSNRTGLSLNRFGCKD
jgi:hypothetical protein